MHGAVRYDDERTGDNGEANDVFPQGKIVEAKGTQNGGTRDFDVQTVFVIDQCQVSGFVDNEGFKTIMKYRQLGFVSRVFAS